MVVKSQIRAMLTIGFLAIVLGVATNGIAIQSVHAATGGAGGSNNPAADAAKTVVAKSLKQTYDKIIINPSLSNLAKASITDKIGQTVRLLNPDVSFCDYPGNCVNENGR